MQRASPSLPKESKEANNGAASVNGCKKRKLYQPVQTKASEEDGNDDTAPPNEKKLKDNDVSSTNILSLHLRSYHIKIYVDLAYDYDHYKYL